MYLRELVLAQWFVAKLEQESHAVTRKPRDAAAVLFGLKYAYNIHFKSKSSQTSKSQASELQTYAQNRI